ncbi:MAG: hypothetical protein QCI00_02685 [Candidatus Thermoplasmatota archaeon]|nr:hypothetical protein [Candidatus Thermoplasmatota archaeon]
MKKMLLIMISVLILVLSSVLIYHIGTDEPIDIDQTIDAEDINISDILSEIGDILIDEDTEIDIGDMM